MQKKARLRLLRLTRDNVNSYQAKQYIGPRIFCFSFLKYFFFWLYFIFVFFFVCFVFLTCFDISLLHRIHL